MTTAISTQKPFVAYSATSSQMKARKMTLKQFWAKYSDREDGFKYEFNNGLIEKTKYKMKPEQAFIDRKSVV